MFSSVELKLVKYIMDSFNYFIIECEIIYLSFCS